MKRRAPRALGILLAACSCAVGLNPFLDVDQYAHSAWTIREGFFKGTIKSIAQTPDGYLWLGTEFGLLRFDGVRMTPWQPPHDHLPNGYVRSLLISRDGLLWIGTDSGLATWKDGKLTHYPAFAGLEVDAILEDRQGTIWVGGAAIPSARLCSIHIGRLECHGEDGRLGARVASLYQDGGGHLWVGADNGLWRWSPGTPKLYPTPDRVLAITEADNGELLVGMRAGIERLVGGKLQPYRLPTSGLLDNLLRDRDGGLWIVKQQGLFHVHRGQVDQFAQSDGLSGDNVSALFEDREGNIWVATNNGLDRFRELAVVTMSAKQGFLDTNHTASVLADRDGSIWVATLDRLNRWKDGQSTIYRRNAPKHGLEAGGRGGFVREIADTGLADEIAGSLFQDRRGRIWVSTAGGVAYFENGRFVPLSGVPGLSVHSFAEDSAGDIWISHDQGLIHLRGSVVERVPLATPGKRDFAFSLFSDPVQRCLWLGFFHGGVTYFKDGEIGASFSSVEGLADGRVNSIQLDRGGAVWAATEGGLSRLKNGRVATLTGQNGLPCHSVDWVMEDDAGAFWLNMSCGVVRIDRTELDSWAADSKRTVRAIVFDSSDGVRSHAFYGNTSPRVTKSRDGRLWFSTWDGLSVIDPRHLPFNKLPPPVHIERITANGKTQNAAPNLHLPPRVRDLEIDYTALTFVAPERVRFRYKLEGQDPDWKEIVNVRQVRYSNLPPRDYRFRVKASNNSGLWNETGDTLDFSIAPAWNQTTWFYAGCVAAFAAMLWGLYRLRIYQIGREFSAQLDGRVEERLQVARELHDTLLQSFHGLLPRFQAVYNLLPGRVADAKQVLETALEDAGKAITEARDAVQGMRSSTVVTNDLPKALELFGEELAAEHTAGNGAATNGNAATFSAEVEGTPQDLQPILRDEIYRISAEALRNAFRHARAARIEVEIRYGLRDFRVRVRDDGAGIDPAILGQEGRTGHFGLRGMRERAEHIGGKLEVWSERGAGTEIELTIPASVAYGRKGGRRSRVS